MTEVAPAGAVSAGDCLRRIDIRGLDDAGLRACIAEVAPAAERRLAPAAGVMVAAVWFDAGAQAPGRLLLTIHHLAVGASQGPVPAVDNPDHRPDYCSRNSGLSDRAARGSVSLRKMACRTAVAFFIVGSRPSTRARGASLRVAPLTVGGGQG